MRDEHAPPDLRGRAAIVTGAAVGLGLAVARKFVAAGARVLMVDRDPTVSARVNEPDLSKGATALVKDLAEGDAASVVFRTAQQALGQVDTLVNNAAWSLQKPVLETTLREFDQLIAINQRAPYFLAQEFLRHLLQSPHKPEDPTIVNIGSVNAMAGNPDLVAYAGTKGALVAMTRALAVEMAPLGVRVNCISPGPIDTPRMQQWVADRILDKDEFVGKLLIRRFAEPEEIADLVLYLCSPAARFVTGANWLIDGGYCAR